MITAKSISASLCKNSSPTEVNSLSSFHPPQDKYPLSKIRARRLANRLPGNQLTRQTRLLVSPRLGRGGCWRSGHCVDLTNTSGSSDSLSTHALLSSQNVLPTLPIWWTTVGFTTQVKNRYFWESMGISDMFPHQKEKNGSPELAILTYTVTWPRGITLVGTIMP